MISEVKINRIKLIELVLLNSKEVTKPPENINNTTIKDL